MIRRDIDREVDTRCQPEVIVVCDNDSRRGQHEMSTMKSTQDVEQRSSLFMTMILRDVKIRFRPGSRHKMSSVDYCRI
ncbi:hypothetical protein ACOSQ3_028811 [Xanthoceras sorbifolium]